VTEHTKHTHTHTHTSTRQWHCQNRSEGDGGGPRGRWQIMGFSATLLCSLRLGIWNTQQDNGRACCHWNIWGKY